MCVYENPFRKAIKILKDEQEKAKHFVKTEKSKK